MTDVPREAITVAVDAACEELDWLDRRQVQIAVELALEAAAPVIRSQATRAERERIRQLAEAHDAAITRDCACGPHHSRFARLLDDPAEPRQR